MNLFLIFVLLLFGTVSFFFLFSMIVVAWRHRDREFMVMLLVLWLAFVVVTYLCMDAYLFGGV